MVYPKTAFAELNALYFLENKRKQVWCHY